ncbi:MAG: NfeD family protein [Eubacteriales bacterium]|nr:NfeD family protein [Eubacteriales bacterium]
MEFAAVFWQFFYQFFWIIVMIAAGVIEILTVSLVSIWFVAGGAVAFVLSLLGVPPFWQWIAFALVSLLVLFLFRGKIAERLRKNHVPTNVDVMIGKTVVLKETVDEEKETGRFVIGDQEWMARAEDPQMIIEAGSLVEIVRIEGVKAIVRPAAE